MKHWWLVAAGIGLLLLVIWLPRALALDHVVTPDERKWLARSANFGHAVVQQDWRETFQREHPGVTIMWAGALGIAQRYPALPQAAPGYFGWQQEELEYWLRTQTSISPLDILNAGRRWVIALVMIGSMIAFLGFRRLFGSALALLILLYIALDPFFVAHSFQLHPDGLLAMLFLAAVSTLLAWLYAGGGWGYLLLSAIVWGLAGLTKTPAVFLLPAALLLTLVEVTRRRMTFGRALWGMVAWGTGALLTVWVFWPALWVDPLGTFRAMLEELLVYAEGHINPNYFLGAPTQAPSPLFYPIAYLLRSTPTTLIGLMAAIVVAWRQLWPCADKLSRRSAAALMFIALVFGIGITFGAKKFDRYFLPAALLLDVVAVLGLAGTVKALLGLIMPVDARAQLRLPWRHATLGIMLIVIIFGQGGFTVLHRPYFLTYYNPLLGGAPGAERAMMIGWGEGMDEAAAWLGDQADAAESDIVAWYGDGPLSYFLDRERPILDVWQPDFWLDADYAVVYVNQRQRDIPSPEALRAIEAGELLHVVQSHGVEWAHIRRMPATPPSFTGLQTESVETFGRQLELAAYTLGEASVLAGDNFLIRLHLRRLGETPLAHRQIVRLLAPDGQELARDETIIEADALTWLPYTYLHKFADLAVPPQTPSGTYQVVVDYCEVDRPDRCLEPQQHVVTTVDIKQSVAVAARYVWPQVELFDLRYDLNVAPGLPLLVNVAADLRADAPVKLSLRLADAAGQVIAQTDVPIAAAMEISLEIPADAVPGDHTLTAVVYDPSTLAAFPDETGAFETQMTSVQVFADAE